MRIQSLRTLDADSEALLRMRALDRAHDVEHNLQQMQRALEAGRVSAVCLYDDLDMARGLSMWRWYGSGQTHVQVLLLYMQSIAPPVLGEALVDYVFSELVRVVSLQAIEVRVRDDSPGVRAAWARRDLIFFERCRMVRTLRQPPLPLVPLPDGYRVVRWEEDHQAEVERLAVEAYNGSIEAVAVPDMEGSGVVKNLRKLRAGEPSRAGSWCPDASLVAVNKRGDVVGYIATQRSADSALIADLGVHPAHRRRGLARLLVVRSMAACLKQGLSAASFAVTTRSPVRQLCNRLGFQTTDCGEVAIWWHDGRQLAWRE